MLLKNRAFLRMFTAYAITTFGEWFDTIAIMILFSYVWQADPLMIALLPLMYAVPGILFGQAAGVFADRWKKVNLMILSDLVRAGITVAVIFAPGPVWVLGLLMIRSIASVFNLPAQQALTRIVVAPEHLLRATTLNGIVFQMSKVLGPFLGGSIAAMSSPKIAILVNAIGFTVSALILSPIRHMKEEDSPVERQQFKPDTAKKQGIRELWKDGWMILLRSRVLLSSFLFGLTAMMAIQLVDFQFAVVMREIAPDRPELTGWVVSAIGIGALCTVTLLTRFNEIRSYGWFLAGGISLIGVAFAWIGMFRPGMWVGWLLVGAFVGGMGTGFTSVVMNFLMQKETPKEAVGRVTGIYTSLNNGVMVIAPLGGGVLVTSIGASRTFVVVGLIIGGIGILGILLQRLIWGPAKKPSAVNGLSNTKLYR